MNTIEDTFRREGQQLSFNGNQPFLLSEAKSVFLIVGGLVDIFAVALAEGKIVGPRTHLCRVLPGEIIPAVGGNGYSAKMGLLGVPGINTEMLRISPSRYRELILDDNVSAGNAALRIQKWIEGLVAGLECRLLPKNAVVLRAGENIKIQSGESTSVVDTFVWVRHLEGSSSFMGGDVAVDRETGFIPHAEGMWLQAREDVVLEALTSRDYFRNDTDGSGLSRFYELVLAFVAEENRQRVSEEEARLKRQAQYEKDNLQDAVLNIASLLSTEEQKPALPPSDSDGLLLAACNVVGKASGIVFTGVRPSTGADRENRIETLARVSRVRMRRVYLKGNWWQEDVGDLLGFCKETNRPLAILRGAENSHFIHDPMDGSSRIVNEETASRLGAEAYQFYRSLPDKVLSIGFLFRFAAAGLRKDIFTVLTMGLLGALVSLIIPIGTGIVFNSIIPEAARGHMAQLAVILVACASSIVLFETTKALALLRIETKTDATIQSAVIDRLLSLPVFFFREYSAGDLAERTMGMTTVRETVSLFAIQSGLAGIFTVFNLFLMCWYNVKLALVALLFICVGIVLFFLLNIMQVRKYRIVTTIEGKIAGMVLQFISGMSKLRVAGAEVSAFSRWAKEFSRQRNYAYQARNLASMQSVFNAVFPALGLLVLFAWISQYRPASLKTGDFLAFLAAYTNLQTGLVQVVATFAILISAVPLFERMRPILQTLPEINENRVPPGPLAGHLEVQNVIFRYQAEGPDILKGVSLEIKPGQFVAVVGSSGSGKSTLLRLLLGFEKPLSGSVYYDGKDLETLDCREVRRQLGVVLQASSILPGTILDNIRGATNLSIDEVWEAARMAGLDEDVRNMPMGLHTFVSPGGETLSGGQRQRLLIARALINKPRIIFFDEATSALDNRTQEIVSTNLNQIRATRVVIAHRLSTIIEADCIYVLEDGRIIESGNYESLMKKDGAFASLVKRQII